MKINLDDPRLTAFALGELSDEEAAAVTKAIADSPEAAAYVNETQRFADALRKEFHAELEEAKPLNIMPLPAPRSFWSDARWASIALAALLAIAAVIAMVALSNQPRRPIAAKHPAPEIEVEFEASPAIPDQGLGPSANTGSPSGNAFVLAAQNPRSSFSLNVGTASYSTVRRALESGTRPPRDAVQIEEMINYFAYDYSPPRGNDLISIELEVAGCPWAQGHRLLRVGLQARKDGSGKVIADRALAEVEFNPLQVGAYRLLGYQREGTGTEGEVRAGQATTALYEIVPATENHSLGRAGSAGMVTVEVRYRDMKTNVAESVGQTLNDRGASFEEASADFRFAAAVAEFGMILRDSPERGEATLSAVVAFAERSRGRDAAGERQSFIELLRKAEALAL